VEGQKKMKALYYPAHSELIVEELPVPCYADNEVLVKVSACGICGSEIETFKSKSPRRVPPLIMGHEFCGTIEESGSSVTGWEQGSRIVSNSIVSCGTCENCIAGKTNLCVRRQVFGMHRSGAFGTFINVPASSLIRMPEGVDPRHACLSEPLANGIHLVKLTKHLPAKHVLVIGAGPIGLLAQQAFQALRQSNIIVSDLRTERLDIARRLGAPNVINPSTADTGDEIRRFTSGEPVDIVIDAVGTPETNKLGLDIVRPGGALLIIGLYKNSNALYSYDIVLTEKSVMGSYAATQQDMEEAVELIASGKVDVGSWVHYYDLDQGKIAFFDMMEAKGNHIKSVIVFE
jgi:threonine dehydrogenase-like Zn-dependent dehydrogenase